MGELLKQRYVGDWFDFVKSEYRTLFPELPDRTRFYRIQNNLERIYADFALRFPPNVVTELSSYVIDSKPVPTCKGVRWTRPRKMSEASSGRGSLGKFYGFKLHTITSPQGLYLSLRRHACSGSRSPPWPVSFCTGRARLS